MNRKFFTMVTGLLILLSSAFVISYGQDAPYRISDKDVEKIMKQLKQDSNKFRKSLDSSLDRSRLDGTNREDDINNFLKQFADDTDKLYDRFKDHKSVSADVETVLDRAARIDQFVQRQSLRERAQRDWERVRQDLRRLAEAYNVSWRWW